MKLNFADNLRTLRTGKNLTQEQLAEQLGVSVQTVSRWETRTSYPDVELLPILAELFGVTVDELLGATAALREQRKLEDWERVYEKMGKDTAETVRLLRQMRRDYPTDPQIAQELCRQIGWLAPDIAPDEMRELRSAAEWLLNNFQDNAIREEAIFGLVLAEDDANFPEILDRYAVKWLDLSRNSLLAKRYRARGEEEKCAYIDQLCLNGQTTFLANMDDPQTALRCIDLFTGTNADGKRPVSGDGVPDLWFGQRVFLGLRLMKQYVKNGAEFCEPAFAAAEDALSLYEALLALPENAPLTYRCKMFDRITGKAGERRRSILQIPRGKDGSEPVLRDETMRQIMFDKKDPLALEADEQWLTFVSEWLEVLEDRIFDEICEEERFQNVLRRFRAVGEGKT